MRKIFTIKKVGLALLLTFLFLQLFRIDKTTEIAAPDKDFIVQSKPNEVIKNILISACYDCHSNQTKYPWYSNVAPVSWWLKHHIDEGREELNFSFWGDYTSKEKYKYLKKASGMVKKGIMPLNSYTWVHKDAKLTPAQKELLGVWFTGLRGK